MTVDCVIPVHHKDLWRLPYCVNGLRRNVSEVDQIYIVTSLANLASVRMVMSRIGETRYRCVDEREFVDGDLATAGATRRDREWLLQQVIKLEAFRLIAGGYYLVLDADVVFLNRTPLFDDTGRPTVAVDAPRTRYRSHPLALPCQSFCSVAHHLLKAEWRLHDVCFICHHMLFHTETLKAMLATIGTDWTTALRDVVPVTEVWSEYDLYAYFVNGRDPAALARRTAPWLDVPWSGGAGAGLDGYLELFRQAGVSFVALHHHFDDQLSVEECVEFARDSCSRLADDDCRGRWPLTQWLARRDVQMVEASRGDRPSFADFLRLAERAFTVAMIDLSVRYSHIRRGGTFAAAQALYEEPQLAQLRTEVLELSAGFSLFATVALQPLLAVSRHRPGAADAVTVVRGVQVQLEALARLISDPESHSSVLPDRISHAVDGLRTAFGQLSQVDVRKLDLGAAERAIDWRSLDMAPWIPFVAFVTRRSAAIARASRWLASVLSAAQWDVIRRWFDDAPLFQERTQRLPVLSNSVETV